MPKLSPLRSWFTKKPSHTSALHVFPNSTIYQIPDANLWYTIVLMPSSPTKTLIRWDLYSKTRRPNLAVEKAIASQIEGMISTQAKAFENLPRIVNDENKGMLLFIPSLLVIKRIWLRAWTMHTESQYEILVQLKAHLRVEKTLGKTMTPTMNKAKTSEKFIQAEIRKFSLKSTYIMSLRF
jgi:hypothetical protein